MRKNSDPFLIFASFLFVAPLFVLGLQAIAGIWRFPDVLPTTYSARAFELVSSSFFRILRSLGSTTLYALGVVVLSFAICIIPASVLAREDFPGKRVVEAFLLSPALLPPITFSMGLNLLFVRIGLSDTLFGVIIVLCLHAYPYMLRALIAGYQSFGQNYGLCALNLGYSPLKVFFRVELPLLIPSIAAGSLVVFLVAFSDYFLVFLIGGGTVHSFTGYLVPIMMSSDRSFAALLVLIFLLIPIIMFSLLESLLRRMKKRWVRL